MVVDGYSFAVGQGQDQAVRGAVAEGHVCRVDIREGERVGSGLRVVVIVGDRIRAVPEGMSIVLGQLAAGDRAVCLHVGDGFVPNALSVKDGPVCELDQFHVFGGAIEMVGDCDGLAVAECDDQVLAGVLGEGDISRIHVGEDQPVIHVLIASVCYGVRAIAEAVNISIRIFRANYGARCFLIV